MKTIAKIESELKPIKNAQENYLIQIERESGVLSSAQRFLFHRFKLQLQKIMLCKIYARSKIRLPYSTIASEGCAKKREYWTASLVSLYEIMIILILHVCCHVVCKCRFLVCDIAVERKSHIEENSSHLWMPLIATLNASVTAMRQWTWLRTEILIDICCKDSRRDVGIFQQFFTRLDEVTARAELWCWRYLNFCMNFSAAAFVWKGIELQWNAKWNCVSFETVHSRRLLMLVFFGTCSRRHHAGCDLNFSSLLFRTSELFKANSEKQRETTVKWEV